MTREPCKYCGQEERYGHNAICVMNTIDELRAENERLTALGRDTLSSLETLGEDGWSEAPYLIQAWRAALEP